MTVVPDDAAICDCWIHATYEERARAYEGRNRASIGPRGLPSCEKCHGAGFWLPTTGPHAAIRKLTRENYELRRELDALRNGEQ